MSEIELRKTTSVSCLMSGKGRQEKYHIGEVVLGAVALVAALSLVGFVIDAPLARIARDLDPFIARGLEAAAIFFAADALLLAAGAVFFISAVISFRVTPLRPRAALSVLAQRASFVCSSLCLAVVFVQLLKFGFGRTQPQYFDSYGAFGFSAFMNGSLETSFPSGHATAVFACATALALFAPRFSVVFLVVALALSASRVVAGAHYPSDVLGGMVLGIVLTIGLARIVARIGFVFRLVDGYLVRRGEGLLGYTFFGVRRRKSRRPDAIV